MPITAIRRPSRSNSDAARYHLRLFVRAVMHIVCARASRPGTSIHNLLRRPTALGRVGASSPSFQAGPALTSTTSLSRNMCWSSSESPESRSMPSSSVSAFSPGPVGQRRWVSSLAEVTGGHRGSPRGHRRRAVGGADEPPSPARWAENSARRPKRGGQAAADDR